MRSRPAAGGFLAGILLLILLPALSPAHVVEKEESLRPAGAAPQAAERVGVDERLGAKIPLALTFRDEQGQPRRLSELITGPTLVVPVYYHCSNVCNDLQWGVARVLPGIRGTAGVDYRVISVSIDETETPQLAADSRRMYLNALGRSFPARGWRFLTGDRAAIKGLTDAAGYRFARRGTDFLHPVATFVVTPDGTIVRYLYGTDFLAKDLTLAFLEAGRGKVGTSIRKMVGYCFSFDPALRRYTFNLLRVSATAVILCTGAFMIFLLATGRKGKRHLSGGK